MNEATMDMFLKCVLRNVTDNRLKDDILPDLFNLLLRVNSSAFWEGYELGVKEGLKRESGHE